MLLVTTFQEHNLPDSRIKQKYSVREADDFADKSHLGQELHPNSLSLYPKIPDNLIQLCSEIIKTLISFT